jgi:hypothetical protein
MASIQRANACKFCGTRTASGDCGTAASASEQNVMFGDLRINRVFAAINPSLHTMPLNGIIGKLDAKNTYSDLHFLKIQHSAANVDEARLKS